MDLTHTPDLTDACAFMTTHARLLDRRSFELLRGTGTPAAVVTALDAYRNGDGGWTVDWVSHSPAAAVEWRGYATVRALTILRAHGVPLAQDRQGLRARPVAGR